MDNAVDRWMNEAEERAKDQEAPPVGVDAGKTQTVEVTIRPHLDTRVTDLADQAQRLAEYADALAVSSVDAVQRATEDLSIIAGIKKQLKSKTDEYTGPLRQHLQDMAATFKRVSDLTEPNQSYKGAGWRDGPGSRYSLAHGCVAASGTKPLPSVVPGLTCWRWRMIAPMATRG